MKIALVNKFLHPKGGADVVALQMARLLREQGHQVVLMGMTPPGGAVPDVPAYTVSAVDYDVPLTPGRRLKAAARLLYSLEAKRKMTELIRKERPDIVHFHNIYHQLSPSVIDAAAAFGIPTVMTLHDFKLTCAIYSHYRDGAICEECRGGRYCNNFRFRCTSGSAALSLLNTAEMYLHRKILNTYGKIHLFICPSRFMVRKLKELGFRGRTAHLPNFVRVQEFQPHYEWAGRDIAYVGRLSYEKGLTTLLDAVRGLDVRLHLIGTGPMEAALKEKAHRGPMSNVQFAGYQSGEALRRLVARCMFTVLPSTCYENNPLAVMESFAMGKPVIGSDIGGIPELIGKERGLCFKPGDATDLRQKIQTLANDHYAIRTMGRSGRHYATAHLHPHTFYERLMAIYSFYLEPLRRGERYRDAC